MGHSREAKSLSFAHRAYLGAAVVWCCLFLFGALNHTIIPGLFSGYKFNFSLPGFQFGYVMFHKAPEKFYYHEYRSHEIEAWRPVAELAVTPSLFYAQSRAFVNHLLYPRYIGETCRGALEKLQLQKIYFRTMIVRKDLNQIYEGLSLCWSHDIPRFEKELTEWMNTQMRRTER
jgi:hypothetical protein